MAQERLEKKQGGVQDRQYTEAPTVQKAKGGTIGDRWSGILIFGWRAHRQLGSRPAPSPSEMVQQSLQSAIPKYLPECQTQLGKDWPFQ